MYEQELDSLLWKVDYKDIIFSESTPITPKSKVYLTPFPKEVMLRVVALIESFVTALNCL